MSTPDLSSPAAVAAFLRQYNTWRRDESELDAPDRPKMPEPADIGRAISAAVRMLEASDIHSQALHYIACKAIADTRAILTPPCSGHAKQQEAEDLATRVKTLSDALDTAESVATARGHTIDGLRREIADLRESHDTQIKRLQAFTSRLNTQLATEWRAREAQQEKGNATDVTAAAVGYLVRVPKRPPMIRRKPEAARLAALSAVRAGAARAEVLAVVPVGAARRGAEWGDA
jgi:hypothetical protein